VGAVALLDLPAVEQPSKGRGGTPLVPHGRR